MREVLKGGYVNEVWLEGNRVVKDYKDNPVITMPARDRYANEVTALNLHGGILAPEIYESDPNRLRVVMEYLRGENMKYHLDNAGNRERQDIFETMGKVLSKLHTPVKASVPRYLHDLRMKAYRDITTFARSGVPEAIGLDIYALGQRLEKQVLPDIARQANTLVNTHGDMWSNNVIGDKIIDWEYAQIGLPQEDLVQVEMWDLSIYPQCVSSFERGYGHIGNLDAFRTIKLLDYMQGASLEELDSSDGFIRTHAQMLLI